jgi:hypothetical protein
LCTKKGEVFTSQGENFPREQFENALRDGPAIFAEDNHARCVKYYNAQVGEQAGQPAETQIKR